MTTQMSNLVSKTIMIRNSNAETSYRVTTQGGIVSIYWDDDDSPLLELIPTDAKDIAHAILILTNN